MNQRNIDINNDSVESAKMEDEQSGTPDKMADDASKADSADIDTLNSDHFEGDTDPAEDTADSSKEAADENSNITDSENMTPDETKPETELAAEVTQPHDPISESLTYMGLDSTAMTDIAFVDVDEDGDSPLNDWITKLKNPKDGEKIEKDEVIQKGVQIAGSLTAEANKKINVAAKYYADRAIDIGKTCILLQKLTKENEEPWGVWAEKNLPFLGKRNRQKFMRLAKRTDCHDFTHLGVDRMDTVCSLTEGSTEEKPIKALFEKYKIPFDETSEVNMSEFRNQIDAAISNERLIKKGLEIDFNLVTNAVNAKVGFNKALIKRLKDIKDCEGNPEKFVKTLTINQGSEGSDDEGEKRLQDFNSLSARLVKTIDYIVKDGDHLDNLDEELFVNLYKKIDELLKASKIEIETEPEE